MEREKTYFDELKKIVEIGYVPNRDKNGYLKIFYDSSSLDLGWNINCFLHACFNLTNEIILEKDLCMFPSIYSDKTKFPHTFKLAEKLEQHLGFIKATGLSIKLCDPNETTLAKNQWKIAYYEEDLNLVRQSKWGQPDYGNRFHFLKQERDGSWTGKRGFGGWVETFSALPKNIEKRDAAPWKFCNTYIITNPYAESE